MRAVEVEEDQREEKSDELEAGVTEGRAQEFQPGNRRQENIAAAGKQQFRRRSRRIQRDVPAVTLTGFPASCGG